MKKILVFLTVILVSERSDCWDLAVAVDSKIQFLIIGGNETRISDGGFNSVQELSYNQRDEIYVVDKKGKDSYIYSYKIGIPEQVPKMIISEPATKIMGVAYSNVTDAIYWTTGKKGALMWYKHAWQTSSGRVLHQFENVTLQGITVDSCGRYLYWTNTEYRNSTIERTRLDYFHREILIKENLFNPMGIAVDWQTRKLFWCDDTEGDAFQIERSNLDGTGRELLYKGSYDEPRTMTVAHGRLFWIDKADGRLLSLRTMDPKGLNPWTVQRWGGHKILKGLTSVVVSSCYANNPSKEILPWVTPDTEITTLQTTATTERNVMLVPSTWPTDGSYCLNDGIVSANNENSVPACKCPVGYTGARCELPLCHNYCVHGTCSAEAYTGWPKCLCMAGFGGDRCETDLCNGYCMNGGTCYWNDTIKAPSCHCPSGRFSGNRCTEDVILFREYCHLYCRQEDVFVGLGVMEELHHCDCSDVYEAMTNNSLPRTAEHTVQPEPQTAALLIACIALGCSVIALLIFLGVALRRMSILNKQPRLRKRIIVNKKARQQELPDRRPSGQSTGEQCEITIENCCNMNICETPCYEPKLRAGKSPTKDEKRNLLVSMEGASTGASSENSLY
ncbi:protein cueball [Schistocerca piceifrons]|uniref:protein cueball n=1 Tax=Schistocerca piceifrons TaxID=274613 RepID=UPI001F5F369F|nr:protein cueball [Schistocerca piceifrons]